MRTSIDTIRRCWILAMGSVVACAAIPPPLWARGVPTVTIRTDEAEVIHEPQKRVAVTIEVQDENGKGLEAQSIRLDASRGRLTDLRELGDGRYRTTYHLPAQRHPQAVILAAMVGSVPPAWTVLKLRSSVDLPVNTSKPRVQLTLTLGGHTYGPVRSDEHGQTKIPVEVGPADTTAQVVAVDEFGNRRRRTVGIPIPPSPRLVGFAERSRLAADGVDSTEIYLIAIRADGSPENRLNVVAARETGSLSRPDRLRPGLYRLTFTAPDRLDRPRAHLTLAIKGDAARSRRTFTFALTPGKPSALRLKAEPARLVADGRSSAVLTMTLNDRAGNPLPGMGLSVDCTRGVAKPVVDMGAGRYRARYIAPIGAGPPAKCRARLSSPEGKAPSAETQLTLLSPVPAALEVRSSIDQLPMDGRSTARIDIAIRDRAGNPVDGVAVQARSAIGAVDPVSRDGDGRYHATFTAPTGTESTRVRIEVIAGEGKEVVREQVIIRLRGREASKLQTPWLSIGPSAVVLTNFGRLIYGGFLLEASFRLPGLDEYLYLSLEGGYRYGRSNDSPAANGQTLRVDLEYAPLHLAVLFKPLPREVATVLVGIGGGLELVQWSLRRPDGNWERDHRVLLGSFAALGAEVRLGPGALVLLARYLYAFLADRTDAPQARAIGGSSIKGSIGGLDLSLGYRLHF